MMLLIYTYYALNTNLFLLLRCWLISRVQSNQSIIITKYKLFEESPIWRSALNETSNIASILRTESSVPLNFEAECSEESRCESKVQTFQIIFKIIDSPLPLASFPFPGSKICDRNIDHGKSARFSFDASDFSGHRTAVWWWKKK